jgi:hypothetical protein
MKIEWGYAPDALLTIAAGQTAALGLAVGSSRGRPLVESGVRQTVVEIERGRGSICRLERGTGPRSVLTD